MNKILTIALLSVLACGQLTINLEKEKIHYTSFEDEVIFHKSLFNSDSSKTKTTFDTTSSPSWRLVASSKGNLAFGGILGDVQSRTAAKVKNSVEIQGQKLKSVEFLEGALFTPAQGLTPNPWSAQLEAGFGLGRGSGNFVKEITALEKQQYEAFSFYFREYEDKDISQIRFGSPEGYFSKEGPTSFQVQSGSDRWELHITNVGLDASNNKAWNTNAYFSTTTRYSYITLSQYTWLKTTLTNYYGILFSNIDQCACTSTKNPEIYFQFSNGPNTPKNANQDKKFTLQYEDFVVKNTDGTCHLSFKPLSANSPQEVILGTSFLKGVYAWFYNPAQGQASVRLANAYKVPVQKLKLDENYRIAFIIVGVVMLAVALLFLLSVLQKVDYQPAPRMVSQQQQQFLPPSSYVIQNQPQIVFRPGTISPNQMVYSQNQRSISPQRIVYQQQY